MTAPPSSSRRAATSGPLGSRRSSRPFVGRGRELEELQEALDEAAAGRGGVMIVTGDAGIGKTRLLTGGGRPGGGTELDGAHRPLLGGGRRPRLLAVDPGRARRRRGLRGDRRALGRVGRGAGGSGERPLRAVRRGDALPARPRRREAGADRARGPARRRRGVAAPASLPRRGDRERSDCECCARTATESRGCASLRSLFAGLARIGRRLPLRGLSQQEVEAYVARVVGEDAARPRSPTRLHSITGGNPFFLGELIRAVDADELGEWVSAGNARTDLAHSRGGPGRDPAAHRSPLARGLVSAPARRRRRTRTRPRRARAP